jgi:hypothetical protein
LMNGNGNGNCDFLKKGPFTPIHKQFNFNSFLFFNNLHKKIKYILFLTKW